MKRRVISLVIIALPLFLCSLALWLPVVARTGAQPTPPSGDTVPPALQFRVHQQVPLSLTIGANPATAELTQTVAVTLDLQFELTLTDTQTVTVPAAVTLIFADQQITTLPISLTVARTPTATVMITLLNQLTAAASLTDTAGTPITATLLLTPTALDTTGVAIATTVAITANLRSGPDTTFAVQATFRAGQPVTLVAQNGDGTWYLLDNGLWVAAFLVSVQPTDLPPATEALATTLREQNPLTATVAVTTTTAVTAATPITVTATPITATTPSTPTSPGLPTLRPTPTPATAATTPVTATVPTTTTATTTTTTPTTAEPPSVTLDANLREGPGTTFPVIGGTVTGQTINIVARSADGSWFRLDNGGWVAAFLVANAPDPATVPLFDPNAPVTTPAPTAVITPTTTLTPTFGVRENLYVIRVDGIADRYDFALTQIDGLVTQAQADTTLLENQQWIIQVTTMITLLRSAGDELQELVPPALFTDAHQDLLAAATAYTTAADLLAEGVDQLQADILSNATGQIDAGNIALGTAQTTIEQLTP